MDTVYATLAAIVTTGGLLLTVNFFSAWRTRASDRALLTFEFDAKANRLALDLNQKLAETQVAATETFNNRTDALLDRVSQDFLGLRQELSADRAVVTSLSEKSASEIKQLNENVKATQAQVKNSVTMLHSLEATVRDNEVKIWEIKDNAIVMLMAQAQSIEAGARAGSDYIIESGAKNLIQIIEKRFSGENTPKLASNIIEFILKRLPDSGKHAELLQQVRGLVKNLPRAPEETSAHES
ncbi:hypothetical protein [Variovorax saccharolyticus]|uniref:hypothetical protein n=1 Tax=Variovorax saccharolyticus TaxID=3053516 RepID=UPI002577E412|nr:hypothetical protein [Variovorax sp. J22R187]MDM0018368.1 hypothetical protein [Variovorax sp. J22R187]